VFKLVLSQTAVLWVWMVLLLPPPRAQAVPQDFLELLLAQLVVLAIARLALQLQSVLLAQAIISILPPPTPAQGRWHNVRNKLLLEHVSLVILAISLLQEEPLVLHVRELVLHALPVSPPIVCLAVLLRPMMPLLIPAQQ